MTIFTTECKHPCRFILIFPTDGTILIWLITNSTYLFLAQGRPPLEKQSGRKTTTLIVY
uniref:Uncharacterized protein n=1 Tax=Siphoviridae sp. cttFh17 TaxID=2826491 RepID=A0A8S5NII6_9CAUD|nr:MAG TPA: hypothetical protein [Siphoviridae sp. cttFh17]